MSHSFPRYQDASWSYSWGRQRSTDFPYMGRDHTFNPTQWGNFNFAHGDPQGQIDNIRNDLQSNSLPVFLVGFNEPDRFNQSGRSLDPANPATADDFDMQRTVEEAVRRWPRLEAMDVPLVSPSPAGAFNGWLDEFHDRTSRLGYRVDHTAIHIYRGPNVDAFINDIDRAYDNWGRPVWVKEFSVVRWSGNNTWTHADNYNFLAEFLWRAESIPHLARYSLFQFRASDGSVNQSAPDPSDAPRSNTYNIDGTLTAFGQLYAGWDGVAEIANHKACHLHNRGRYQRVRNPAADNNTVGTVSPETDTTGIQWFLIPGTTENTVRICSTEDGRRLRFLDGSGVGIAAETNAQPETEWRVVEHQHGWFFIEHPDTNRRLRVNESGDLVMGPVDSTGGAYQWRFAVPAAPEPVAPPDAPSELSATLDENSIALAWSPPSAAVTHVVRRSSSADGPWDEVASGIDGGAWTDDDMPSETTWQIRHSHDLSNPATWPVIDPDEHTIVTEGDLDLHTLTPHPDDTPTGFFVLEVIPAD